MEKAQSGLRRMGTERWKYLDMANLSFAAGEFVNCNGYINAFIETIDETCPESKELKDDLDSIEEKRRKQIQDLINETEELGYLEQKDIRTNGRERIEIDVVHDRKTVCWTLAIKYGLFGA